MSELKAVQTDFCQYLRAPDKHPAPTDVEVKRLNIYRHLLMRNINGFFSRGFPVIHAILSDTEWQQLLDDYFEQHQAHTPLFTDINEEFVNYLAKRNIFADKYPFLHQLAHYEWAELALSIADVDIPSVDSAGDLLSGVPVVNPATWLLAYTYPVHQVGPEFLPRLESEPCYLLLVRNTEFEVEFYLQSELSAHLYQALLENTERSGQAICQQISPEVDISDQLLLFKEQGVVLG